MTVSAYSFARDVTSSTVGQCFSQQQLWSASFTGTNVAEGEALRKRAVVAAGTTASSSPCQCHWLSRAGQLENAAGFDEPDNGVKP